MNIFQNIFGPNWRTTLSGWITALASAIAVNPGLIAFLPESYRNYIAGVAGIISVISGCTFASMAKDRNLTGNGTVNDPYKVAKDGENITLPPDKIP